MDEYVDLRLPTGETKELLSSAVESLNLIEKALYGNAGRFVDLPVETQRQLTRVRAASTSLRPLGVTVLPLEAQLPPLSGKVRFLLLRMGISTVEEIESTEDAKFLAQRGLGPGSLSEIRRAVAWARQREGD